MDSSKNEIANSQVSMMKEATKTATDNLRVCTLCKVTAVYDNGTLDAQPIIAERIRTKDNSEQYQLMPTLLRVPYFMPKVEIDFSPVIGILKEIPIIGSLLDSVVTLKGTIKPKVGEYCACVTLDRASENININDGEFDSSKDVVNANSNKHSLSNCIAFVGLYV